MTSRITVPFLLGKALSYVRAHPWLTAFLVVRNLFVIGAAALGIGYAAFAQSKVASEELSADFGKIAETQDTLLKNAVELQTALLTPDQVVDLQTELSVLRGDAEASLTSLAQMRVPTKAIENARFEYKASLETLIGVTNSILRHGPENQAPALYAALQRASNDAGAFRGAVERFQGGAIPQVLGGIF